MPVTGKFSVAVDLKDAGSSDRESYEIRVATELVNSFVDGVGAGAVNAIWQDVRPLTDGGNETLDVSPTPTSGKSGVVTFARIKGCLIWAPATNTTNITITGTLLYLAAGDAVRALKPGGVLLITDPSAAGMVVTPTTVDTIILTNSSGAAATYGVILAGALT